MHNGLRDTFCIFSVHFKQGRRTMVTWSHDPYAGTWDAAGLLLLKEEAVWSKQASSPPACWSKQNTGILKRRHPEIWALHLERSLSCLCPEQVHPCFDVPGRKQGQREVVAGSLQCQWGQSSCWASLCYLAWWHLAGHLLWLESSLWNCLSRLPIFSSHLFLLTLLVQIK